MLVVDLDQGLVMTIEGAVEAEKEGASEEAQEIVTIVMGMGILPGIALSLEKREVATEVVEAAVAATEVINVNV